MDGREEPGHDDVGEGETATVDVAVAAWLAPDQRPLDWNGPTGRPFVRFRDQGLDRPVIELIECAVRRHPDRIALTDAGASVTYAQLWDGLSGLAQIIGARTRPGELVAILQPAGALFPLAMLACLAIGRPFAVLDPDAPGEWLGQVLEDARPALIIGRDDVLDRVPTGAAHVIPLTGLPRTAGADWRPTPLGPDEPACVLFTSGSTGRPKGVVISHRGLLQRVAQSINAAHINAQDRLLTVATAGAVTGVRDALTALVAGASFRLVDPQRVGAREILEALRTEAITILFAFPALLRTVLACSNERPGEALRLIRIGGDVTLWSDIDRLRAWAPKASIQLIYAATEAPMMQWFVDDACRTGEARIPIGYPLPGNRLAVVDAAGRPVPPGEVGELVVESPHVALGLWTRGGCVSDGFEAAAPGCRRFRTGDMVRQRPDGLLERLGRRDRQVKIRGARVELDGVEAALRQHPQVRDVGVLARAGADGTATLVAHVSARDGASTDLLGELKVLMRQAPAPMRPSRLYLTGEIPRLPSSKLDVRALMALDEARIRSERVAAGATAADGDAIAQAAARAWREVLQAQVHGPDEDFFDAGGDSLKAISLTLELERALDVELPLSLVHEAPTFAGLCEALRAQRKPDYVPLVPLKPGDGPSPVFFVHGAGGTVADLLPIARSLAWPGPVIGIQARGLSRRQAPHPTVEAMADDYLAAIKTRQPRGPYYLCGYSFGGLVAFEMARRLREAGDEIGLVGLFDTMTSPLGWPLPIWLACVARRAARFAAEAIAAPGARLGRPPQDGPAGVPKSAPASLLKVAASAVIASARYRPGFYPGELKLFIPAERDPALPSPQALWGRHAAALSIVPAPGAHLTMLSRPHAAHAAASLTRCLQGG